MRGYLWTLLVLLLTVVIVLGCAIYALGRLVASLVRRHEEPFFASELATPTPRPPYRLERSAPVFLPDDVHVLLPSDEIVTAHGVRIPLSLFHSDQELDDCLVTLEEIDRIGVLR